MQRVLSRVHAVRGLGIDQAWWPDRANVGRPVIKHQKVFPSEGYADRYGDIDESCLQLLRQLSSSEMVRYLKSILADVGYLPLVLGPWYADRSDIAREDIPSVVTDAQRLDVPDLHTMYLLRMAPPSTPAGGLVEVKTEYRKRTDLIRSWDEYNRRMMTDSTLNRQLHHGAMELPELAGRYCPWSVLAHHADEVWYVGETADLPHRLDQHETQYSSKLTRAGYQPAEELAVWYCESRGVARAIEKSFARAFTQATYDETEKIVSVPRYVVY